ncbi:hypothetical protein QQP08_006700 [Theobroma cacao]|nr:hypothetical protein QQP08_006700 [Theobroma cacao]
METYDLGRKTMTAMEEPLIRSIAELVEIGAERWVTKMGGERNPSPIVEQCNSKSTVQMELGKDQKTKQSSKQ